MNQDHELNQPQSNIYTFIDAKLLNFENDGVYIRFRDRTLVDTAIFNMTLSGGQLVKEANIYASMIYIDSTHTEFFFFDYEQSMSECGFFRPRCKEPFDDKFLVLEEIETRFLDIL